MGANPDTAKIIVNCVILGYLCERGCGGLGVVVQLFQLFLKLFALRVYVRVITFDCLPALPSSRTMNRTIKKLLLLEIQRSTIWYMGYCHCRFNSGSGSVCRFERLAQQMASNWLNCHFVNMFYTFGPLHSGHFIMLMLCKHYQQELT